MGVHDKEKYPEIKRLLGIPEDEPIFILRAQDRAAVGTLIYYYGHAGFHKAEPEFMDNVGDETEAFRTWQRENEQKVKTPD